VDHQNETPPEPAPIAKIGRRASRFSREYLATLIAVVSTALGVVVALAWNAALQALFNYYFHSDLSKALGLLVYAVIITAVAVIATISMGKLARRLDADPIHFTFPEKEK